MGKRFFKNLLILTILFLTASGCHRSDKFDRQKWSYGDGLEYPQRNDLVDDLVKNHHLKGLTYRQVIDSLGRPQSRDTLILSYQIMDNSYEYNRKKPIHKKNLILYFSKDSVVTRIEVYDHANKK
jgi:outer membrane protein assembly factor BamE (lipoprotein component of BamABCDE complex)